MSLESSYLVLTGKGQGRLSGRGGNLSRDLKDKVKMQKGKSVLDKRDSVCSGQRFGRAWLFRDNTTRVNKGQCVGCVLPSMVAYICNYSPHEAEDLKFRVIMDIQ